MKAIIKKSYTIKELVDIEDPLVILDSKKQEVFSCYFYGMPACCGITCVKEIGSIHSNTNLATDEAFMATIDRALNIILELSGDSDNGCMVYVANLIDNDACNLLRDAFVRTNTFINFKTFINNNSDNEITMWVSNN